MRITMETYKIDIHQNHHKIYSIITFTNIHYCIATTLQGIYDIIILLLKLSIWNYKSPWKRSGALSLPLLFYRFLYCITWMFGLGELWLISSLELLASKTLANPHLFVLPYTRKFLWYEIFCRTGSKQDFRDYIFADHRFIMEK